VRENPKATVISKLGQEKAEKLQTVPAVKPKRMFGLINMGNTCFFNATLQCVLAAQGLHNYFASGEHQKECKQKSCVICLMA